MWKIAPIAIALVIVVLTGTGCPTDKTPPQVVTEFTATGGDAQVVLTWKNPTDSDFNGVKILRKEGSAPTSTTDGTVIFDANATTFTNTGLTNGVTYYFAAFAFDKAGNFSAAAQSGATPTSPTAHGDILGEFDNVGGDIAVVPDGVFTAEQRQTLQTKLDDAEHKYRGGDPCAAGLSLLDFLGTIQQLRQGTAIPTAEELYNRGRMLRYNMLEGLPIKSECTGQERIGVEADTRISEQGRAKLLSVADFGEPKVLTFYHGDDTYTELQVPGADAASGVPGEPAVPILRRIIAVPIGSEFDPVFNYEAAETVKVNLVPVQTQAVDEEEDPFGNKPFVKDEERYAMDAPYPTNPVTLSYLGDMRDARLYLAEVATGQYNPKTQEFQLFKNVSLDVEFVGGSGGFITEASTNGFDDGSHYQLGSALNRESVLKYVVERPVLELRGEELMILTPPSLRTAADTLAAWKRSKGITTKVFEVADGSGSGPDTNTAIDNLIKNEYDTAIIRPSYVLLLGDAELIPTFYPAANGDVGSATIGSDWQYAVYGDPVTDRIPDFAVGRIPVDTLDQANIVVNKIIAYEQTPPNNIAFYANAAIASQFQCCRTDVTQAGTDQRTFIEASEFARDVMVGQGKTVARIYTRTIDGAYTHDATPRRYFDGTLLPAALGPGYAWNGTTVDIVNAYNAGRFLMIHRDHGGPNAWIHPGFGVTEASGLTNGNLTPVVFSVNCASGLWDNETAGGALGTSGTAVYLAETLLRKSGGGAVGVLGDTRNSPSWPNSDLLRGFIDAIWPTALPVFGDATPKRRLGDILNHGKLYMMTRASVADADDENRLWHCIGDPTMEIYVRNPYRFVLSSSIWSSMLKNSLLVDYPVDGVSITAFQQNPTGGDAIPIGRGTVVDGIATLPFVNEPNEKLSFTYVVNADDLPPLIIQK